MEGSFVISSLLLHLPLLLAATIKGNGNLTMLRSNLDGNADDSEDAPLWHFYVVIVALVVLLGVVT